MLRLNSFSGGSNGTTITTGNSGGASGDAFDDVVGSPVFTTSQASGSRGPLVAQLAPGTGDLIVWTGLTLAARTIYVRAHVYITASPSSAGTFISCDSASPGVSLTIDSSRHLSVVKSSGGSDFALQTGTVPTNQWCRIETMFTIGTTTSNGACEIRRYDSADSPTASEITSASAINLGTALPDYTAFSFVSGLTTLYDNVGVSDVGWIGPVAGSSARSTVVMQAVNRSYVY